MKKKEYAGLEEFLSNGGVVNISLESPLFDRPDTSVFALSTTHSLYLLLIER